MTYKGHLNKESLYYKLKEPFKESNKITHYSIVNETSSNGYMHTHALIIFLKRLDCTNPRAFDYKGIHPHIRVIEDNEQQKNAQKYIEKDSFKTFSNMKTIKSINIVKFLEKAATCSLREMVKEYANSLSDVQHIRNLYMLKDNTLPNSYIHNPTYTWQQELLFDLTKPPNNRTIIWYIDYKGNCGKTTLSLYLENKFNAFSYSLADEGAVGLFLLRHVDTYQNKFNIITVDIPKACGCGNDQKIYTQLESFKNGKYASTKYNSIMIRLPPVHVVVFSNYKPYLSKSSHDRWLIRVIEKHEDDCFVISENTVLLDPTGSQADTALTRSTPDTNPREKHLGIFYIDTKPKPRPFL